MSLPLKDLRTAIPDATDLWLEIESRTNRIDKAAVVRKVLNAWARDKAHAFKVAHQMLRTNGAQTDWLGEDTDDDGHVAADAGTSRKCGRG